MVTNPTALVIGSGVIGLQTTLQLLQNGVRVVLRSPRHPLNGPLNSSSTASQNCSMGGGGKWFPTKCDDLRVEKWAIETLDFLLQTEHFVEIVPTINLFHRIPPEKPSYSFDRPPAWTQHPQLGFEQLSVKQLYERYSDTMWLPDEETVTRAGYEYAWLYYPPIVDTPKMLQHMLSEITQHPLMKQDESEYESGIEPIELDTGKFYESAKEIVLDAKVNFPHCRWIFNCTGIGCTLAPESVKETNAKYMDPDMVGSRGVLLYYDRRALIRRCGNQDKIDVSISIEQGPWGSPKKPAYVIPRGNILVCGGSYDVGDRNPNMTENERKTLEFNASILACVDTDRTRPGGDWIGFRPVRRDGCVRVEVEDYFGPKIQLIHNYGHGGSGWTVYIGAVHEAIRLMHLNDANPTKLLA